LRVKVLTPGLLEQAAALFVGNYSKARERQPLLPAGHADGSEVLQKLADLAAREQGVAVERDGRLVGYGVGLAVAEWHGSRAAFMPEWGHATVPAGRADIYRVIYEALSRRWAADGRVCHLVCMLTDGAALDEWQWMGFGLQCVDALRGVAPPAGAAAPCDIRRAGPADASAAAALMAELRAHLSDAPVHLPPEGPPDPVEVEAELADPKRACFLAVAEGEPVGYVTVGSANPDAGWVVQDPGTASVDGAYMQPRWRRRGVGTTLLDEAVRWARDSGYVRCAVDFEAHNAQGTRFWLRHFEPVCYAVVRVVRPS
jgi:GNAT superfamily N-acetyltransferase